MNWRSRRGPYATTAAALCINFCPFAISALTCATQSSTLRAHGIYCQMIAAPRLIVTTNYGLPVGKDEARYITMSLSTRRRCSRRSEHRISTSMNCASDRTAALCHASRVSGQPFTESPITSRPRRRLSSAIAYAARHPASFTDPVRIRNRGSPCSIESTRN
jgi:hypothetical protein